MKKPAARNPTPADPEPGSTKTTIFTKMPDAATAGYGPPPDCDLCPRLVDFRRKNQETWPDWHNGPVPSFGSLDARLLIVGLAPGLKGANRTGRPFTGDYAGDLLYQTLTRFDFATGTYDKRPDDDLQLHDCRIANGVRCLPPENKPIGFEVKNCRPFLVAEIEAMKNLKVILALGASPTTRCCRRWANGVPALNLRIPRFTRWETA